MNRKRSTMPQREIPALVDAPETSSARTWRRFPWVVYPQSMTLDHPPNQKDDSVDRADAGSRDEWSHHTQSEPTHDYILGQHPSFAPGFSEQHVDSEV